MKQTIMKRVFITAILMIGICSCLSAQSTNPQTIRIDIDATDNAKLKTSINEITQIETNESSKIGRVSKIKFGPDRIFILDRHRERALFAFDGKGNYIGRTPQAGKLGSLISPFAFAVNKSESVIYFFDIAKDPFLKYDYSLKYSSHDKFGEKRVFMDDFWFLDDNKILSFYHIRNPDYSSVKQNFTYSLHSLEPQKTEIIDLYSYGEKKSISLRNGVSHSDNTTLLITPWNYKIYQLINGKPVEKYILDFGKYNLSDIQRNTMSTADLSYLGKNGTGISTLEGIWKTEDYIIVATYLKSQLLTFIFSEIDGKTYCLNDNFESDDLPRLGIWGISNDGSILASIKPEDMMQFQKATGKYNDLKIKKGDNPLIISFRIQDGNRSVITKY